MSKKPGAKRWDNAEYRRNSVKFKKSTDQHYCHMCGEFIDLSVKWPDPLSFSTQHIIPRSRGGGHEMENLAAAHKICQDREGNALAGTVGTDAVPRVRLVQSRVWHS